MTIKQLREAYEALLKQFNDCQTILKGAGEDFDMMSLPVAGENAGEKSAAVLALKEAKEAAYAAWQNAIAVQKAVAEAEVQAPVIDEAKGLNIPNINMNRGGKRFGSPGEAGLALMKGEGTRQSDGSIGVKIDSVNGFQKLFQVTSGGVNTTLQSEANLANDPDNQAMRVISRFLRTRVDTNVYVIQNLTAGTAYVRNRTAAAVTEAGTDTAGFTYSIQGISANLPVPMLLLGDHAQLEDRLNRQLEIALAKQIALQLLGTGSNVSTEFVGATTQITNSADLSTANALTKILERLETEVGLLDEGGAAVDTIFLNWTNYMRLRKSWRTLNYAWPGTAGPGLQFGEVMGAAVIPTNLLPNATHATDGIALMGPFASSAVFGVREDVTLSMHEDTLAASDQILLRARMEGALGIEQPAQIFRKLTKTGSFTDD